MFDRNIKAVIDGVHVWCFGHSVDNPSPVYRRENDSLFGYLLELQPY